VGLLGRGQRGHRLPRAVGALGAALVCSVGLLPAPAAAATPSCSRYGTAVRLTTV